VDGIELTILVIAILGLAGLTYIVGEYAASDVIIERATVIDRFYEGARTGVGVGVGSNGSTTTVIASSSARYNLLLEFEDGSRDLVRTDKVSLTMVSTDENYKFYCRHGYFSGQRLRCTR
jgi:hypothetical protein